MGSIYLFILLWSVGVSAESNTSLGEHEQFAYALFKELIEADTTHWSDDTLALAESIADRLRLEGVPANSVAVSKELPPAPTTS